MRANSGYGISSKIDKPKDIITGPTELTLQSELYKMYYIKQFFLPL